MRISLFAFGLRPRCSPLPAVLAAFLTLQACGGEDLSCGGPFCIIPPGRPEATKLRPGSGNGQTGAPGRELALPLEVVVTDDDDRPIPDVEVAFTVNQGSGTLSIPAVRSDHQGRAQVRWTLGAEPGPQAVRAEASDAAGGHLDGSPLTLSAQGVRPPPARLILRQAPSEQVQNGILFVRQPVVAVVDTDEEPVPEVNVTVAIAAGGGSLSGTTTVSTDPAGRASYADLAILGATGQRTLQFSVADPPLESVSASVEVAAGTSSQIAANPPLTYEGIVNSPVTPPPAVVVKDDAGNPVPGAVIVFTADRDASVSPRTVTTNELGVAQVTSWTLGRTAGTRYSLSAGIQSLGGAPVVFLADARAGAAGGLAIVVQPSGGAQSGTPFGRQPVVRVVDLLGNPAPQPGISITATLSSGPAGTLQNASATTNASGRATFSGLTLTGLVGDYTLSFSAPSLAGVTSARISLSTGSPSGLALVEQPSPSGRSRVSLPVQPAIQLQDAQGNPISQAGIAVVASIATGGGTLSGATTAVTDGSGRAAFTDLTLSGAPGSRTLRFASTSPPAEVISGQVTLPDVATVSILSAPPGVAVVGTELSNPAAWSLADAEGQPVADVPATLSVSPGNTIAPSSTSSDENGTVQLQSWTLSQVAGEQSVELGVSGTAISRVAIQATPALAFRLQKVSGDSQSAPINSNLPEPMVVRVVDQFGNGVSDVAVQWRTCDGVGDYDAFTDIGGFASAVQETGPEPGTFCGMASSVGLADSPIQFTFTATAGEGSVSASRIRPPPPRRPPGH